MHKKTSLVLICNFMTISVRLENFWLYDNEETKIVPKSLQIYNLKSIFIYLNNNLTPFYVIVCNYTMGKTINFERFKLKCKENFTS